MKTAVIFVLLAMSLSGECSSNTITFDDSAGLERHFDGIGGLSGGGATSKLLMNYPEKQKSEILDYLFKPNFGASLQILKVEIGGDAQSTDGTEASHMHNSWDENYQRGYEWWLMVEAKKRNPNIKLYGLPWTFPGWVGDGKLNPYTNPKLTSTYIIKWILGAKKYYNLTIDYIGIWNERNYNTTYIKTLRKMLDSSRLTHVRIVASDSGWGIAGDILKDRDLDKAVDYIGAHYPGTGTTPAAFETTKQLWASEDYSTFNDNKGAGCWARILNQNYVNGYMTSTISWNLIASYYSSLPYYRDGLMTAVEPWSGNYVVEGPIWITAHTTQFTQIGWKYLRHNSGVGRFSTGGSYVGLASNDSKDLTIVIETMSHDHSVCIRPALKPYNVVPTTVNLVFDGSFASLKQLNVWYSKPSFSSQPDIFFMRKEPLEIVNGTATLQLNPDEVYTLTTLTGGTKGTYGTPPASKAFPLPYTDDFEGYTNFMEPFNLAQQTGSFEVIQDTGPHGMVLRQMVLSIPVMWCKAETVNLGFNIIGAHNWTNISAEIDFRLGNVNGTNGVFLALRVDKGGCNAAYSNGIFLFINNQSNEFLLTYDIARKKSIQSGQLANLQAGWNTLSLSARGTNVVGKLNQKVLFKTYVPAGPKSGFVGLGTSSWGIADFDNLKINDAGHTRKVTQEDTKLYFVPSVH